MSFNREQATARGSGTNTFNIPAFGVTPTAGNVIFVLLGWIANGSNNVDVDITDDQGGLLTWNRAVTSPNNIGARTAVAFAFNIPTLSSNPVITVTRQGGITTVIQGSAEEWSGFGTNNPFSVSATRTQVNVSSATSNTTGTMGELDGVVFAIVQEVLVATGITVETVVPAWTQIWDANPGGGRGEADYKVVSAGGTQICRWTFGSNTDYSASIAVFCLNEVPTAGVRANQAVATIARVQDPSPLRANQTALSLVTQSAPLLRWNQVVLTVARILPATPVTPKPGCPEGLPASPVTGEDGCAPDLE